MESRIRDCQKLPVGERDPEERQSGDGERRRRAQPRANRLRGAPYQDYVASASTNIQPAIAPAIPGSAYITRLTTTPQMAGPTTSPCASAHAVVRLSQRHADNDVADGGKRHELREQEQQPGDYRSINRHISGLTTAGVRAVPPGSTRPTRAANATSGIRIDRQNCRMRVCGRFLRARRRPPGLAIQEGPPPSI